MKLRKILFSILLSNAAGTTLAQIEPFNGIHDVDSCRFEMPCHLAIPDTTVDNIWQRGAPQKAVFSQSYSQPNAMITDTLNTYPTNTNGSFDLRFPLEDYYFGMDIIIGFRHKYHTDTLTDGGFIETSYDLGNTWGNLLNDQNIQWFFSENMYTTQDTLKGGTPGFSGSSNGWIHTQLELIYAFPVKWPYDTLLVRFHFISDSIDTGKDGWMIDNILTSFAELPGAVKRHDLSTVSVTPNPLTEFSTFRFENDAREKVTIELTNSSGITVRTYTTHENNLVVEKGKLPKGLYLIKLIKGFQVTGTGKLMVQ